MKVTLKQSTPKLEQTIVEIARVSSSRKDKTKDYTKLLQYLIEHKHYSPFEHGTVTFEIETSKAIGIQLIRHRSFTFQEFSQRYQDVGKVSEGMFEPIELRKQADNNRQSSTEVFEPIICGSLNGASIVDEYLKRGEFLYNELIKAGVAREQARMILPLCTKTKIYMTGTLRSWIHFLDVRDDAHAQKEIQLIAKGIKQQLKSICPITADALKWN